MRIVKIDFTPAFHGFFKMKAPGEPRFRGSFHQTDYDYDEWDEIGEYELMIGSWGD